MLITPDYRHQLIELHKERQNFGKASHGFVQTVFDLCSVMDTTDVLDYGCGKGELNIGLPFGIQQYDPAIRKYSGRPRPADLVVCTDVLEHIEPDCLEEVLKDLKALTKIKALLGIPMYEARRILPDGRNAHLIIENDEWWSEKITAAGFEIEKMQVNNREKADKTFNYLVALVK